MLRFAARLPTPPRKWPPSLTGTGVENRNAACRGLAALTAAFGSGRSISATGSTRPTAIMTAYGVKPRSTEALIGMVVLTDGALDTMFQATKMVSPPPADTNGSLIVSPVVGSVYVPRLVSTPMNGLAGRFTTVPLSTHW